MFPILKRGLYFSLPGQQLMGTDVIVQGRPRKGAENHTHSYCDFPPTDSIPDP